MNWAPIWEGATFGGGVNGYCQALALELASRGHAVTCLFGGLVCVPGREDCFVRRHHDWLGIRVFEVINSPVLAPSISQFHDPVGEVSQPELEGVLAEFFRTQQPNVVHWHNLEGFSAGCVDAAKRSGARVVFSLHNYHTVCSQVTLTREHRWACHDFDGGRACDTCVKVPDPVVERAKREREFQVRHEGSAAAAGEVFRKQWGAFKHELSWPKRVVVRGAAAARAWLQMQRTKRGADGGLHLPGMAIDDAATALEPLPVKGAEIRGMAAAILDEQAKPAVRDARDRPVLNVIQPAAAGSVRACGGGSGMSDNAFGLRRRALVSMLAGCDEVLAVSGFVGRLFESMGVPGERLTVMPIGTRVNETVARNADVVFDPPAFEEGAATGARPVRLVFLGYNHFNKGLPLLADAIERLDGALCRGLDLSIFALGGESIEWRFRRIEPRLAKLTMIHGYKPRDIPWCLGGKDLAYVGSTWWDPAPQTVFEAFACGVPVLGAELGGIPEFVHHGVNGLLFRGNDADSLACRLEEVLSRPAQLMELRRGVRPPKSMAAHAAELEAVYARGAGGGGGGIARAGAEATAPAPASSPSDRRRPAAVRTSRR